MAVRFKFARYSTVRKSEGELLKEELEINIENIINKELDIKELLEVNS